MRHMETRPFIRGIDLSEALFREAVQPLMTERFADMPYSAGLLYSGSEVLGFDTPQSRDHDWGPRLQVFLAEDDYHVARDRIDAALRQELPVEIRGYPVDMAIRLASRPPDDRTRNHVVGLLTVRGFFQGIFGWDPMVPPRPTDWVAWPEQYLRSIASGRIFHDGLGQLRAIREALSTYPHDVWLYLLAAQWQRISQEEHFMGRCGQVGDDLGSRLIAARLVRDLMRLCFLMEREYAPYIKWFGTAFAQLGCAPAMTPALESVLRAETWRERETHLSFAYEAVAAMHNALGITPPLSPQVSPFYDRPFLVIHAERFADAIWAQITDLEVLAFPPHLGAIDQWTDSTDVLNYLDRLDRLRWAYRSESLGRPAP